MTNVLRAIILRLARNLGFRVAAGRSPRLIQVSAAIYMPTFRNRPGTMSHPQCRLIVPEATMIAWNQSDSAGYHIAYCKAMKMPVSMPIWMLSS